MIDDPTPVANAIGWLDRLLAGDMVVAVAVVGVAAIGLGLLMGRISVRRGGAALLGCFLMIGAHSIASGLIGGAKPTASVAASVPQSPTSAPPLDAKKVQKSADPYSGASLGQ